MSGSDAIAEAVREDDVRELVRSIRADRDEAAKHGPPLGFGITCLQISIALASVCLITKRKALWGASALLGAVGILYLVYGLYLV